MLKAVEGELSAGGVGGGVPCTAYTNVLSSLIAGKHLLLDQNEFF